MTTLPEGVKLKNPEKLYIGGQWVAPAKGGTISVVSPHTEEVSIVVAEATDEDMDKAVKAARDAFDNGPWPNLSVAERAAYLRKLTEGLQARAAELSTGFVAEIGALVPFAAFATNTGAVTFAQYADIGESYPWEERVPTVHPGHDALLIRDPVGVVAAIAPWNMPFAIMAQKVAPALIAGCTVIMKPSPETPIAAYAIAEVADEIGIPAGVINLVPANRDASDYLVRNPGIDKISFTGSTVAGKRIASVAGERIARVTLELGGKSPAIVLPDYPTEEAGKLLGRTITNLSGQICATLSRALVPQEKMDEMADAIAAEMKTVKVGDPNDPESQMGPIAMERQIERIEGYVAKGIEEGAELVTGGKRVEGFNRGYYFEPTLFKNVDNKSTIAQEEIFGPVLALIGYRDVEHAIELANDSNYGLNSSVLTHDTKQAYQVGRKIRAGNVGHNGMKADFTLGFGGYKQSGIGREGGVVGLEPYIETKTMIIEAEKQPEPAE